MEDAKENGLAFNSTKCNIKTKFVKLSCALYDENGIHPDLQKVEDIKFTKPTKEAELQHVLGMVTSMGPFIPWLSECTANLPDLLKKISMYVWTKIHEESFQQIKALISKEVTLAYFDTTKQLLKLMPREDGLEQHSYKMASQLPLCPRQWHQLNKDM